MVNEIGFFQVLKMLFILAVILFCTYYVTKLLANKAAGINGGGKLFSGGYSKNTVVPTIVHRMAVDRETRFMVIEYNNCDYLIAVTGGAIEVVEKRELSQEEIRLRQDNQVEKEQHGFGFSKYLEKYINSQSNKGVDKD